MNDGVCSLARRKVARKEGFAINGMMTFSSPSLIGFKKTEWMLGCGSWHAGKICYPYNFEWTEDVDSL